MPRLRLIATTITLLLVSCGGASTPTTGVTTTTTSAGSTTPTLATTTSAVVTTTPTTTTSEATTTSGAGDLFRIRIEEGVKTEGLDTISVRVGETVRFEVVADADDEVHVHGYDLTFETIPDEATLVEFVAHATGIFEVELEGSGIPVVDIEVTP